MSKPESAIPATADVVVVGGGIVGSATAYFLTRDPAMAGRVVVVERDPTYARASTPRSAGSIRQQFSTPENIRMSQFGMAFLRDLDRHLGVDGEPVDVGFRENGYLFLASADGVGVLEANHRVQRACDAAVELLDPAALARTFPWLATEGIAAGSFGTANEGWFDPHTLLMAFRRKARAQGAVYVEDEVVAVERTAGRVDAVGLASGGRIGCGTMVCAAGPNAGRVAALAGAELPVAHRKRFVYVFDCKERFPQMPLVICPNGVWVRPEGAGYVCGTSPPEDQDPDCEDLELDYAMFDDVVWPTIAERIPAFEAIKLTGAWAGHYDFNTVDHNGIIGRHPEVANLIFANGFSGHGLQQAPATGRAVSELILAGRFVTLDLSRFAYTRFAEGRLVQEINVV
ncbi:NAD(P)/FAD-dependent oxidoreductase [Stella sp.]|uniref:NAD(P)/FAD-dependent oxidoreductase n=1 Tax=Stella sp. TaxID=2912054 RepID=UPI0035B13CFC